MTDTQRRIREYKKALPHMKERVTAVALLLAVSVTMMASVSFAWVTLSQAPEVNSLATTISTNGNLEIALSDTDGLQPEESAVGDGAGDVTKTNLTWGNLINLAHESYGLDYLTLRPAVLNSGALLTSPLRSVKYGSDGRVSDIISNFSYTNFQRTEDGKGAFFVPEDGIKYGVRAISSVTFDSVTGDAMLVSLSNAVANNQTRAMMSFTSIYNNQYYMNSITGLAGVYLNYRMEDVDQDCTKYVEPIYKMMQEYIVCLDYIGQTLLAASNLHHFIYCNNPDNNTTYTAFTIEQLNNGTVQSRLAEEGITLAAMATYLNCRTQFYGTDTQPGAYTPIKTAYDTKSTIGWEAIRTPVNIMANIYTATLNGTQVQSIGKDEMLSMAGDSGAKEVVVQSGLIVDTEKMLGTGLQVSGLTTTVMGIPVTANVKTNATVPYYLVEDVKVVNEKAANGGLAATDAVAADTYGMALDFWLRTNAVSSKLKLEGELIYETRVMTDADGNPILDDEGNERTETVLVGYSGSNRIWDNNDPDLPAVGTSTSQGSGSCYVFYPSSPEDQKQSLELLKAMCVAFVDAEGNLLAQADLDTEHVIEDSGRVLVPLQLRAKTVVTVDPETQQETTEYQYYITEMTQNQAIRITAVVYMDGSRLNNSQVLSAGSINGHLNIQFGSDDDLTSTDNPNLKDDYYVVGISASKTDFAGYDPNNPPKTTLTLTLEGMEANAITGNFVSYISATQGARQPTFRFEKGPGMTWTADVTFTGAGKFQLRSVQIDGVDYVFDEDQILEINIPGVTVDTVTCLNWNGQNSFTYLSTDPYYQLDMEVGLNIGTVGRQPSSVQAVFAHESGQNVTVNFNRTNNGWVGKGNFTTSGKYTLSYMIIDGAYTGLTAAQQKTMDLTLGVQVQVYLDRPVNTAYKNLLLEMQTALNAASTEAERETIRATYDARIDALLDELYEGDPLDNQDSLELTETNSGYRFYHDGSESLFMDVTCIITDDQGNELGDMTNVKLHYGIGTSVVNRTDTDLTWNDTAGCYEGELEVRRPGTYSFQTMTIGSGENASTITSAPGAPKIQAISPTPIQYVGKSTNNYYASVVNISKNATRWIGLVLRDAPSAEALLTVRHTDNASSAAVYKAMLGLDDSVQVIDNGDGTYSYDLTVTASKVVDASDTDWFFYVDVPHDGTWTITDVKISSAFYGGTFYDGVEDGGTGYLTPDILGINMADENITTQFFTTVNFSADKEPDDTYRKPFMTQNFNDSINFTMTDYLGNAVDNAAISLTYTWNQNTMQSGYSLASGTIPAEWKTLGGATTVSADGTTFTTSPLTFLLDGEYVCDFSVTINGIEYALSQFNVAEKGTFGGVNVLVYWDEPDVQITGVTPNMNTSLSVNLASGMDTNKFTGVKNYYEKYYANMFIYMNGDSVILNGYAASELTMKLMSGYGGATGASVVAVNGADSDYNRTFAFTGNNDDDTKEIGAVEGYTRKMAGKNKQITHITMSYGNVSFNLPLYETITINQENVAPYLTFAGDTATVAEFDLVQVTYGNGTVTNVDLSTLSSLVIISIDGRPFDVKLPGGSTAGAEVTSYGNHGTVSGYIQDPNTATQPVYYQTSGFIYGTKKYNNYTRTTFYTTQTADQYLDRVDTTVASWTVGSVSMKPGAVLEDIATATTATVVLSQKSTRLSTTPVILYKYYIYDVLNSSNSTSHTGTSINSWNVYTSYTHLSDRDQVVPVT